MVVHLLHTEQGVSSNLTITTKFFSRPMDLAAGLRNQLAKVRVLYGGPVHTVCVDADAL